MMVTGGMHQRHVLNTEEETYEGVDEECKFYIL